MPPIEAGAVCALHIPSKRFPLKVLDMVVVVVVWCVYGNVFEVRKYMDAKDSES